MSKESISEASMFSAALPYQKQQRRVLGSQPADVAAIVAAYADWLATAVYPNCS